MGDRFSLALQNSALHRNNEDVCMDDISRQTKHLNKPELSPE